MPKNQAFNPFLPSYEYIPDGEPRLFGDRLYLYGSHDRFKGRGFCLNDYVCWSAPLDDLSAWRYEGVIYRKRQTPPFHSDRIALWAPDVCQGADGRFYLYFFVGRSHPADNRLHVAVSEKPEGPFAYLDAVKLPNGAPLGASRHEPKTFDPAVLADDDGRFYLYSGFSPLHRNPFIEHRWKGTKNGPQVYELAPDMKTIVRGPSLIGVPGPSFGKGTSFESHEFFEASSIRKFHGRYYFIYSSIRGHELCYATSAWPDHGFSYGGTLVSIGDVGLGGLRERQADNYLGNTHGSVVCANGHYYVFYHRQTNRCQFSRQACAEEIAMDDKGAFAQAELTSCGLNGGPLAGKGEYEARIACNLSSAQGTRFYGISRLFPPHPSHPYFTQEGSDREGHSSQYIANMRNGSWCAFKYFVFDKPARISAKTRGTAKGQLLVAQEKGGQPIAAIPIVPSKTYMDHSSPLSPIVGKSALYFVYVGSGHLDFFSFAIS